LVHVPADGSKATLISIPRDSWVTIPGHPDAKINAAYADGYYYSGAHGTDAQQTAGASTLIATVKQLTGVSIDHYVQVGFAGFVEIVRAIGTIPVNMCRSVDDTHAYNVSHGESGGSGFDMSAGHHDLTPLQALEFVRQRHNIPGPVSDDLGRELRQRYFLSAAFKKILSVGTLLDPLKLRKLVSAVDDAFTFDTNFDILKLAEQMINLSAGNIVGRSIPNDGSFVVGDPAQDALKVDTAEVQKVVRSDFYGAAAPSRNGSPGPVSGHHGTGTSRHLTRPGNQGCVY
jgi:LCP family protein required for cell wall assembly